MALPKVSSAAGVCAFRAATPCKNYAIADLLANKCMRTAIKLIFFQIDLERVSGRLYFLGRSLSGCKNVANSSYENKEHVVQS